MTEIEHLKFISKMVFNDRLSADAYIKKCGDRLLDARNYYLKKDKEYEIIVNEIKILSLVHFCNTGKFPD